MIAKPPSAAATSRSRAEGAGMRLRF